VEIYSPIVLTNVGIVWTAGNNQRGYLGTSNHVSYCQLTRIDPVCFQDEKIGMISAGESHPMALSFTGESLWTWGDNQNGHMGVE